MAEAGHVSESGEGFEGAEEDASRLAIWKARDVETEVISIDEVDINVAGRSEEDGIAEGASGGRVGGGIVDTEIGFGLDDASSEDVLAVSANENLTEKFAGYDSGIAIIEGAG